MEGNNMVKNFEYPTFDDVKFFYDYGVDDESDVQWYVEMGVIDKQDYVIITGQRYPEETQD